MEYFFAILALLIASFFATDTTGTDPELKNPSNDDCRLSSNSPFVNRASPGFTYQYNDSNQTAGAFQPKDVIYGWEAVAP